jgi:hypothetical protein
MRWQKSDEPRHQQRDHERRLAIDLRSRVVLLSRHFHIVLLGLLLLAVGCGPPVAVTVPNDLLPTWRIKMEPVQIETAAPFAEHIDLRAATMQFPRLTGIVAEFHAPWRVGILKKRLSVDTRDALRVELLPRPTAILRS